MKNTLQKGFTLVELLIVIVILAILATLSYPSYERFIRKSRLENVRSELLINAKTSNASTRKTVRLRISRQQTWFKTNTSPSSFRESVRLGLPAQPSRMTDTKAKRPAPSISTATVSFGQAMQIVPDMNT